MTGPDSKDNRALAEWVSSLSHERRHEILADLTEDECDALNYDWCFWARKNQLPPEGNWFCWLILAGRGFGKTRTAVEWIRGLTEGDSPLKAPKGAPERIALVADTFLDGRLTMIEGESGLLAVTHKDFMPTFESSNKKLVWPNGIQAFLYSAESPDQLRGPQHHVAWADELAKWRYLEDSWSNLLLGLRLGKAPRVLATTTPRNIPLLRRLVEDETTQVVRGSTYDNRSNLPQSFFEQVVGQYEGTRIGRQEIYGEILSDVPGALWNRDLLENIRVRDVPLLSRVVVAVDPPVTSGTKADTCGIIVAGRDKNNLAYILEDCSVQGLSPLGWAKAALAAYHKYEADRMVAEVNNGGELVETLLRQIDPDVSYRAVRASRGKVLRAEPVAALYEQERVKHHGFFAELEDQMCSLTTSGLSDGKSPDRLDAMVWAVTELLLKSASSPKIRRF
ncbi:Gene Transfer Agent terminase protein [hydrothermal vent metagenome]|uniref:Gene Transfer Agent terminase protein n=1 Tax=hydrothermal vent metagenome TaxID=652676 RepID=A0A3B1AWX4_9ZZZZ